MVSVFGGRTGLLNLLGCARPEETRCTSDCSCQPSAFLSIAIPTTSEPGSFPLERNHYIPPIFSTMRMLPYVSSNSFFCEVNLDAHTWVEPPPDDDPDSGAGNSGCGTKPRLCCPTLVSRSGVLASWQANSEVDASERLARVCETVRHFRDRPCPSGTLFCQLARRPYEHQDDQYHVC